MEQGKLQEVMAAVCLTAGLASGGAALYANHEADKTGRAAGELARQNNYVQAVQYEQAADSVKASRDFFIGLAALNFGLAGANGACILAAARKRRNDGSFES